MINLELADTEDALDQLINQFTDPLIFVRELVKNAIAAASPRVEVRSEFIPAAGDAGAAASPQSPGTLIIHVDDWGRGMNRSIIDSRLTQMFNVGKEPKESHRGWWATGFFSVFALRPDAVCVDTGHAEESWRVLFYPDRSFIRRRLHEPVRGTKIQVLKTLTRDAAATLAKQVEATLRRHCRHVAIDLRYDGKRVSGPLSLSAVGAATDETLEATEHRDELHLVLALTPPHQPDLVTYYNEGLLMQEKPSPDRGFSYKVESPRFGSLGTDETSLPNKKTAEPDWDAMGLSSAVSIVAMYARAALGDKFSVKLQQALTNNEPEPQVRLLQENLALCLGYIDQHKILPSAYLTRLCACSVEGKLLTFAECLRAADAGKLLVVDERSPMAERLSASGMLVLPSRQLALGCLLTRSRFPLKDTARPKRPSPAPEEDEAEVVADSGGPLRAELMALLGALGSTLASIQFEYMDNPAVGQMLAVQTHPPWFVLAPRHRYELDNILSGELPLTLVIHYTQATMQLLPLVNREPELCAYMLAKWCLVGEALTAERASQLLCLAIERRCRRLGQ